MQIVTVDDLKHITLSAMTGNSLIKQTDKQSQSVCNWCWNYVFWHTDTKIFGRDAQLRRYSGSQPEKGKSKSILSIQTWASAEIF